MVITAHGDVSWSRMSSAVERVQDRLLRATRALDDAQVPYGVIGDNAVTAWVSRVDLAAVRNAQDVDILLRRVDLDHARDALQSIGFVYRHVASVDMFLDGPDAKARDAVHVIFANERVRPEYVMPAPDVSDVERTASFSLLTLDALVRMKLTSFRDKDRVHVRDLIDVNLVDATWASRLPAPLGARLQALLNDPDG